MRVIMALMALSASVATANPAAAQAVLRTGALMPVPAHVEWRLGALSVDSSFTIGLVRYVDSRLDRAVQRFRVRLETRTGMAFPHGVVADAIENDATLRIAVDGPGQAIQTEDENERYALVVDTAHVTLRAATVVGALRGMETLLQLVSGRGRGTTFPAVAIDDGPRFPWRGLLVDVSRHFIPVDGIKRTLDGMAVVKLNVLHWHLTDDQGFRVESRRYPRLQASGSDGQYYTQAEIREVVAYARDRGIRVVPEFDMPGHSTSWFVGYPQYASPPGKHQIVRTFGPGDASFDPSREATYIFIDRFIGEMVGLFPDPYWHVGGDEVIARHWNRNARIRAYKRRHRFRSNGDLQAAFNQRLARILTKYHKQMVGWDEIMHPKLPAATVIQSWRGDSYLDRATAAGYRTIVSSPYYLDRILTAEEHYLADPIPPWTTLTPAQQQLIIGGEACMWTEHANAETIDSRIWPRLGAIAERFWSPRDVNNLDDMYRRMNLLDSQLAESGIGRRLHQERMLARMTSDESLRHAVETVLLAVAPPTFGQRIRGQGTTQLTPLDQMIDVAVPDPWGRWETSRLVRRLLGTPGVAVEQGDDRPRVTRDSLELLFRRWRDAAQVLQSGVATSPRLMELEPAAAALARVSEIGLEALGLLDGANRAPAGWADAAAEELTDLDQPHLLLRLQVVPAVRLLVNAAAVHSH